jgi:4-hydroxybenzoate polyprenyltransferase
VRHPIAQGFLSFKEGLAWSLAWGILALLGAYMLNPVCAAIFLAGALLESVYCLMWRVSHFRTIVSGGVKTTGALAAVFAVDPNPSLVFILILFLCLFFWEIGGQNIPADWTDIEEDRQLNAQTIPVFFVTRVRFEIPYILATVFTGGYLLLNPAVKLYKTKERREVMTLFNKASYYPVSLLAIVTIKSML